MQPMLHASTCTGPRFWSTGATNAEQKPYPAWKEVYKRVLLEARRRVQPDLFNAGQAGDVPPDDAGHAGADDPAAT